ncbi:MAG: hypothetical protein KDA85_05870 [Planctomycetaceae bacterium]|nr:hypothetical protein [Planctomycetaceae bacterium]
MNRFSKIAAVLVTVVSVMFFAISLFTFFVHPNAEAEMLAGPMQEYAFEKVPGETPTWKVARRTVYTSDVQPDNSIQKDLPQNFTNPYKAILEAHKDLSTRLSNETSRDNGADKGLKERFAIVKAEIDLFTAHQASDLKAIQDRIAYLERVYDDPNAGPNAAPLKARYEALSQQLQNLLVESTAVRNETAARRTDVSRLQSELDETRTDYFRLIELEQQLTDELVRLELEFQSLQERRDQLQSQQP